MKYLLWCWCFPFALCAQDSLHLTEAYQLLEENYPLLQNVAVLQAVYQLDAQLIDLANKPTINLMGNAQIQSETPQIDAEGLPISVDLPLYSIKTYGEAQYNLYDGGVQEAQLVQKQARLQADKQQLEVEKFKLQERLNQLFLNVLLLREQTAIFALTQADLATRRAVLEAGVRYGTVLESEVTKLQVRELELTAEEQKIEHQQRGFVQTIATLIGRPLADDVVLLLPKLSERTTVPVINRPEERLFQLQKQALLSTNQLLEAQRKPKLNAFAQAGVGYPNPLNFFDSGIAPYAVGGVRFQWAITDWGKMDVEKQKRMVQTQQFDNQYHTLLFNIESNVAKYQSEIENLQQQIENTEQIAQLQNDILQQLAVQLDNGVITSTDYLIQTNAELRTRQQLEILQAQLVKTQVEFLYQRGALTINE